MIIQEDSEVKRIELASMPRGDAGWWPAERDRNSERERSCHGRCIPVRGSRGSEIKSATHNDVFFFDAVRMYT